MKKRFLSMLLALLMILTFLPVSSFAATIVDSGTCGKNGDNVTWTLDSDGLLTISGTGEMESSHDLFGPISPFYDNSNNILYVTIEYGVTIISPAAFCNCSKLISVTIPNSVTEIDYRAFFDCYSLSSVTIPNSVTRIGQSAFRFCSNLTSVTISDSVAWIGTTAFSDCYSLTDVYYSGTEDQWNKILIQDGNEPLYDAVIHFNSIQNIASDDMAVRVVNEWGKGESRAAVTYVDQAGNTVKLTTDSYGYALLSKPSVTDTTLTVKKGERTWNGSTAGRARYSEIMLPSDPHRLASALYSVKKDLSHPKDLLITTKTLNLKNDGNYIGDLTKGNFYLRCTALDPSLVSEYELWQNDKKIETSKDGVFSPLSVKSFSLGGGCFVRSIGKDGSKTDTKINLEFASNTVNEELALDWGMDEITFTVPDRIPFVGGSTVKSKMPMNFPVSTYFSENKVRLLINVNAAGGDTDDELFDEVRELIDDFKAFSGMDLKDAKALKPFIRDTSDAKFFKDGKLQVLGYLEGNYGENTATGQLLLQFSIKAFDGTYNTVVYVVPVTVQFTVELEAGLLGQISYDFNHKKWGGKAEFNVTPKLTAFGGIGYDKALSVGAYGKGELAFSINLIGEPHGLKTVDLTAELGLKAYVAFMEFSRAFAHQTWHLYTKNAASLYGEGESWNAGFGDASQYEVSDLSYLRQESQWLGGSMSLLDAEARTTLTPLLTDTYRNARPTMISDGSSLYAAFVRADEESGARYVSVTRNHDGVWSAPVQADPDAILDSSPALCAAPDGTIWLAFARTTADSQDSLLTYAQNQEIVVGTIDPETLAFTEVTAYSGDYVHAPLLTVLSGNPVLSWIDAPVTDENSVLTQSSGTICCAAMNGGSWGAASEIVTADGSVTDYAVGMENGAYAAAYAVDNTLYQVREGQAPAVLSDVFTGAVRYGLLPGTDAAAFLWNGENVLNSSDGTSVPVEGITSEFAVSGNHIYYSMDTDGSADLASLLYDTERETWSFPIVLTDGNRYLENLNVAEMNGQDYILGMHTAVAIGEDTVDDPKNLVFSAVQPVSDLCIEEAVCDTENPVPGDNARITLKLTNHGDHTVEAIKVMRDGQTVTEMHMPGCGLVPGDSMVVGANITYPSKLTDYQFSVSEVDQDDYTPDDNTYTLSLGYADAAADLEYLQIGTRRSLLATIENRGVESAGGKIVFYDADGNAVEERSFENLAAGDQIVTEYTLDPDFAGINGGTVSAEVVLDQEEVYTYNNRATVTILEPQTTIRSFDGATASVYCKTDTDAAAICAFYDAEGKMLQTRRLVLEAGTLNALAFEPPKGAVNAKLCVLDPVNGWKPLTEAMEQSIS